MRADKCGAKMFQAFTQYAGLNFNLCKALDFLFVGGAYKADMVGGPYKADILVIGHTYF